ncbi:hypothetical protein PLICRDRAFT_178690 [Plicaturopsis crispa FD-325 SS-3]|nr:hypothetical protein PLICRDRAFT_178690 [Plicaturopsis crispa FD-325 SS-3]
MPFGPELTLACLYASQQESTEYFDFHRAKRSEPGKHPFEKNNKDKDVARVLDALAECSMYKAQHQSVSVSLTVTETQTTLYVAQVGGAMDVVVDHLHGITNHLHRIRDSASSSVPPEYRYSRDGFDIRVIREFATFICKFSIDKLRWRILKHIDTFLDEYLPKVPKLPVISHEDLKTFAEDLRAIRTRLPLQGPVEDRDVAWLMERVKEWDLCWRLKPRGVEVRDVPKFIDICVKSTFSFERYLQKILFCRNNCFVLLDLLTCRHLSVFLNGGFNIEAIPSIQRPMSIDIRYEAFLPHLKGAQGLSPDSNLHSIYGRMVEQLIRVATANGATLSADRSTLDFGLADVHPECVLVAYHCLHWGLEPFPYLGMSQSPCRGCQCYISSLSRQGEWGPPTFSHRPDASRHVRMPWVGPLLDPLDASGEYTACDALMFQGMINGSLEWDFDFCAWQHSTAP